MKLLFCFLLIVAVATAEEAAKKLPTMPEDVTLTSGRVLHHVQIIRWETNRVVVKYAGGADPIAFSLIKSISPEDLTALRDAGISAQKAALQQKRTQIRAEHEKEEAERELAALLESLVEQKKIAPGMSTDQVKRAWGNPTSINSSGGAGGTHEQWIYRQSGSYVYFENGVMTSWQQSG